MDDKQITAFLEQRDEAALSGIGQRYGAYLKKIAYNILGDVGESEECLNDVLMKIWEAQPPAPENLRSYLIMLARRSAVDILRRRTRQKRRSSEYSVSLEELGDTLLTENAPEAEVDAKALAECVERWLFGLSEEQRAVFLQRYYLCRQISKISESTGFSRSKLKSMLMRLRNSLKTYLEKENFI